MISTEAKLSAVIEALKAKGNFAKFTERSKTLTGVEAKLNCALAVLKETASIAEFTNEAGQWDLRYAGKESAPKIVKKNNGVTHNFDESNPLNEKRSFAYEAVSESGTHDPYLAVDKMICESMGLTKEETKKALNRPYGGEVPEDLSEDQRQGYRSARSIGISEADALRLVKITGGKPDTKVVGAIRK